LKITIKLFARLRELVGSGNLERTLPEPATITDLIETLKTEFPDWAQASPRIVVALNQEFVA
jgi:molybdopterin converting factor small subunit